MPLRMSCSVAGVAVTGRVMLSGPTGEGKPASRSAGPAASGVRSSPLPAKSNPVVRDRTSGDSVDGERDPVEWPTGPGTLPVEMRPGSSSSLPLPPVAGSPSSASSSEAPAEITVGPTAPASDDDVV